jgi:hypothetical protein
MKFWVVLFYRKGPLCLLILSTFFSLLMMSALRSHFVSCDCLATSTTNLACWRLGNAFRQTFTFIAFRITRYSPTRSRSLVLPCGRCFLAFHKCHSLCKRHVLVHLLASGQTRLYHHRTGQYEQVIRMVVKGPNETQRKPAQYKTVLCKGHTGLSSHAGWWWERMGLPRI